MGSDVIPLTKSVHYQTSGRSSEGGLTLQKYSPDEFVDLIYTADGQEAAMSNIRLCVAIRVVMNQPKHLQSRFAISRKGDGIRTFADLLQVATELGIPIG